MHLFKQHLINIPTGCLTMQAKLVKVPIEHCHTFVEVVHELLKFKEPAIEVLSKHLEQRAHLVDHLKLFILLLTFLEGTSSMT